MTADEYKMQPEIIQQKLTRMNDEQTLHVSAMRAVYGAKGGKVKNPLKGFGSNRKLASEAGSIGGSISRRRVDR